MTTTASASTRLGNIISRQRQSRTRDLVFVAFVALATVVGVTGVRSSAEAASARHDVPTTSIVAHR